MNISDVNNDGQLKVLYLEDDPRDVKLIKEILESEFNIDFTIAKNKEEFIEASTRCSEYDIILSDYKLPGYDAIAALNQAKKECPNIPFICISGAIGEERAVEILKLGATDYVLKDRLARLVSAIERALQEAEEKKALQKAQEALERQNVELRIAKEKAEESDRLKTAFLANLSHEIRTPMNGILGFSELAMEDALDQGTLKEYLEIIHNSSEKLLGIFNNILDISMIETNQLIITEKRTSISKILEMVFDDFYPYCNKKGLSLVKKEDNSVQLEFVTDEVAALKILTNLLDNAVKFTESGFVEFGAKIENGFLNIFVQDTGIGIPETYHEKIFEKFYQAEPNPLHNWGGNGLGLTICKSIVEKLGGKIWLESTPSKGSQFFLKIPVKDISKTKTKAVEKQKVEEVNFKGMHFLVVEDEEFNFLLIDELLKPTGASLTYARNGLEAIEMYNPDKFALILMDIRMPVMDGIQAAKTIKQAGKTPIVAVSAYNSSEDKKRYKESGFDGSVAKPVRQHILFETITKVLMDR